MPVYEYECCAGHRFSVFAHRIGAPDAACPTCGREGQRRVSRFALTNRAGPGPGPDDAPRSWEAAGGGDPEVIGYWRRALERRQKLEERYPELARPKRPVLAHEGPYERAPLYADEPVEPRSGPVRAHTDRHRPSPHDGGGPPRET